MRVSDSVVAEYGVRGPQDSPQRIERAPLWTDASALANGAHTTQAPPARWASHPPTRFVRLCLGEALRDPGGPLGAKARREASAVPPGHLPDYSSRDISKRSLPDFLETTVATVVKPALR
ncbi:hypothetical protein WA016_04435 [Myxococcus stipitatus]